MVYGLDILKRTSLEDLARRASAVRLSDAREDSHGPAAHVPGVPSFVPHHVRIPVIVSAGLALVVAVSFLRAPRD